MFPPKKNSFVATQRLFITWETAVCLQITTKICPKSDFYATGEAKCVSAWSNICSKVLFLYLLWCCVVINSLTVASSDSCCEFCGCSFWLWKAEFGSYFSVLLFSSFWFSYKILSHRSSWVAVTRIFPFGWIPALMSSVWVESEWGNVPSLTKLQTKAAAAQPVRCFLCSCLQHSCSTLITSEKVDKPFYMLLVTLDYYSTFLRRISSF